MNKRRFSQIISLLILHSSAGFQLKWLCNPVLSCHSCVLSYFACPIGVFTQYAGNHLFPFFAIGTVLLFGVIFGRLLCGWVCPFGLLQDLLFKIPTRKFLLPQWTSKIKYLVLLIMVILIPFFLGGDTYYSFCRICPAATLQSSIPSLIIEKFTSISSGQIIRIIILIIVIITAIMSSRIFCKIICPIGAILAPLNLISFWTIKMPEDGCTECAKCHKVCIMNGSPSALVLEKKPPNKTYECVVCHECKEICPVLKQGENLEENK